jgi:hypothetical protein
MNEHDPHRTIIQHDHGFTMVNSRSFYLGTNCYVLPIQCEYVFYSEVPSRAGWSFVVRYDPRGMPVKYNVVEEDDIEEDDDAEEKELTYVTNEELEEDQSNVLGDNAVLDDDVNEDMLKTDIDDNVDIINPLNTFSELEDIDVE